ncbi:MAG: hemerythrin domain-containing protein [Archangium sp.]|nr:hemerythrin domain-containing protein [Archangium sp.]MDP3155651.1 hemerythrin domain-containing protein [Archangium sp.]MDP3570743.1 hemerythrin domain-containing protein [Archangium sp.]
MEATALLRKQHQEVIAKFKQFEKAESEASRRKLFVEIADALAAHTTIEEKLFYPTAYRGEDLQDLLREAVEEHLTAKRVISDLLMMEVTDEQFAPKVKVLRDIIEHHVQEEQDDIFPKVKKALSRGELTSLGEEMEAMFDQLITTEPRQNVPTETARAAQLH